MVPSARVCYFRRVRPDGEINMGEQQVLTVPYTRHTSLHQGEINVLLTIHNDTIAKDWLRRIPGPPCEAKFETLNYAMQLAVLLRLSMIVVLNMWCDVESRETEYELHSVAYEVAKTTSKCETSGFFLRL